MEIAAAPETAAPETAAPETAAPEAPAPEAPAPEAPAPETAAQETETPEGLPEEAPPEEPQTPRPKARPKGRPKGSKTVNRRPRATADSEGAAEEGAAFAAAPSAVVETPPDIFEIIRQRQTAQFERRQAFYQSFLPVR